METQTNPQLNKRILVVEDTVDTQYLLSFYLEHEGYEVITATNGEDALKILKSSNELPAVIFLDLMMPIMDGPQFIAEQKKDRRLSTIPVVIMSAATDITDEALKLNASGYLKKPLRLEDLLRTSQKYCGHA